MDPLTQGVVGAVAAQVVTKKEALAKVAVLAAASGMAPDLDVFIRSPTDPLLALEYHRHFTHALFFIPLGALLCASVLHYVLARRWGFEFKQTYLWCLLGYSTHGLLDGCTSYGTQLFWPLSSERFSWDIISVIDPLVTIPLMVLSYLSIKNKRRAYAAIALTWFVIYFMFGFIQRERVLELGKALAKERNHKVIKIEAKPSFGNLIVWKLIYETEKAYFVDAIKPGFSQSHIWEGGNISKLNVAESFPWLDLNSQQAKDIERFRWFSSGYLAVDPNNPLRIVDIRYSLLPHEIEPLWGIELSKEASSKDYVRFNSEHKRSREALHILLSMILK